MYRYFVSYVVRHLSGRDSPRYTIIVRPEPILTNDDISALEFDVLVLDRSGTMALHTITSLSLIAWPDLEVAR